MSYGSDGTDSSISLPQPLDFSSFTTFKDASVSLDAWGNNISSKSSVEDISLLDEQQRVPELDLQQIISDFNAPQWNLKRQMHVKASNSPVGVDDCDLDWKEVPKKKSSTCCVSAMPLQAGRLQYDEIRPQEIKSSPHDYQDDTLADHSVPELQLSKKPPRNHIGTSLCPCVRASKSSMLGGKWSRPADKGRQSQACCCVECACEEGVNHCGCACVGKKAPTALMERMGSQEGEKRRKISSASDRGRIVEEMPVASCCSKMVQRKLHGAMDEEILRYVGLPPSVDAHAAIIQDKVARHISFDGKMAMLAVEAHDKVTRHLSFDGKAERQSFPKLAEAREGYHTLPGIFGEGMRPEVGTAVLANSGGNPAFARDHLWQFDVQASLACSNHFRGSSDIIGAIDFDHTGEFFATGGIARKVRIYSMSALQEMASEDAEIGYEHSECLLSGRHESLKHELWQGDVDIDDEDEEFFRMERRRRQLKRRKGGRGTLHPWGVVGTGGGAGSGAFMDNEDNAHMTICTPAKLSSLKWVPGSRLRIGCGDYDGVVAEWDLQRGMVVCERDEHAGQRVWSVDYCHSQPGLSASASDDSTVKFWSASEEHSVGTIQPASRRALCCVEFAPAPEPLLALASADSNVYLYDLRRLATPLAVLRGHMRAVSYTRFVGRDLLASSSIDSTVRMWDISVPSISRCCQPNGSPSPTVSVLREHQNRRNFVGLAVKGEGKGALVATGSESNEIVLYQTGATDPVLTMDFSLGAKELPSAWTVQGAFVSALCWRQQADDCTLVAANSDGVVRIIQGHRLSP